jgi:hypothetical protein
MSSVSPELKLSISSGMRTDDDDERQDGPAGKEAEQPGDAEPWAKTSSGDADSITDEDDE